MDGKNVAYVVALAIGCVVVAAAITKGGQTLGLADVAPVDVYPAAPDPDAPDDIDDGDQPEPPEHPTVSGFMGP